MHKRYNKSLGFTLAEVLLVLTAIGVLFALTALNITGIMADSKKARFKKSYSTLESAVAYLVRSDAIYGASAGFKNTEKVVLKNTYEMLGSRPEYKFRDAFRYYVGAVKNKLPCKIKIGDNAKESNICFQTDDGVVWGIPDTDFVEKNTVKVTYLSEETTVVPITIYLDYENNQNPDECAYIAAVTYRGNIILPVELNNENCDDNSKNVRCNIEKYVKSITIKSDNVDR